MRNVRKVKLEQTQIDWFVHFMVIEMQNQQTLTLYGKIRNRNDLSSLESYGHSMKTIF